MKASSPLHKVTVAGMSLLVECILMPRLMTFKIFLTDNGIRVDSCKKLEAKEERQRTLLHFIYQCTKMTGTRCMWLICGLSTFKSETGTSRIQLPITW